MPLPLITDTVEIYRLTRTGNKDDFGATPVYTGLDVSIVPASEQMQALFGGAPSFSLFEVYMSEPATLKNGDKITSGSKEYIIRGTPQVIENRFMNYQKVLAVMAV